MQTVGLSPAAYTSALRGRGAGEEVIDAAVIGGAAGEEVIGVSVTAGRAAPMQNIPSALHCHKQVLPIQIDIVSHINLSPKR